jgi:hypothetical protein
MTRRARSPDLLVEHTSRPCRSGILEADRRLFRTCEITGSVNPAPSSAAPPLFLARLPATKTDEAMAPSFAGLFRFAEGKFAA